ncbi:MAG: hypothetical protein ACRETG_03590 [Steroidobacteraceae bacterium]
MEFRARFLAGQLESIVPVAQKTTDRTYYGLASFRWFNLPPRWTRDDV